MTRWNVVAAVGLENNTDGQTRYAIETAASLPANLTVLYVGPDRIFARRMSQPGGGSYEALLERNPAQSIVRYAHAVDADLILLMDDHFGVRRRFWKPTVAQAIMRLSPKSVVVAAHCLKDGITNEPLARAWPYRVILCPLSLDASDGTVLDHAAAIAGKWDAELVLLGVVPEIDDGLLAEMHPASIRPLCPQRAANRLQFLASRLSVPNRVLVRTGSPEKEIEKVSRECEADLLIAARAFPHGTGAFRPDVDSLRRKLRCPVLSVVEGSSLPRPAEVTAFETAVPEEAYVLKKVEMTGAPVITFAMQQPYLSALRAVRQELRRSCLHVAAEVDVASRIRRELGAGVAACRILYVDDPVLLLEAVVFNRGASLGIPQPVIVSGAAGNKAQVIVRSMEAMGNGVPASAHELLRQLHSRIVRTIGAIGQQEEEPALAASLG